MYIFGSKTSFSRSFETFFSSYDSTTSRDRIQAYLFTGPVPETINDIPWDIQNVYDTDYNSIAQVMMIGSVRPNDKSGTYEAFHNLNTVPVKHSHWDRRRKCWRLMAKTQARNDLHPFFLEMQPERATTDRVGLLPNQGADLERDNIDYLRWSYYFGSATYYNERYTGEPGIRGDVWKDYGLVFGSRYPLAYDTGVYFDFGTEVTVDKLEVYSHGSTSYTCAVVVVETWDETNKVWVEHWRNDTSEVSFNVQAEILVDIPQVTARRFRVSGVDTGRYGWYIKHISLLSTVEPADSNDTSDITWALIYPMGFDNRAADFDRRTTQSETQIGRLPILKCSVGDISDPNHVLLLNKAKNMKGGTDVRCTVFNLQFSEG